MSWFFGETSVSEEKDDGRAKPVWGMRGVLRRAMQMWSDHTRSCRNRRLRLHERFWTVWRNAPLRVRDRRMYTVVRDEMDVPFVVRMEVGGEITREGGGCHTPSPP